MAEQPFRSTLNVTVEVFLRQLVVDFTAGAQNISNAMISRADLLASLLESEQQETSSCPQSPNDDHFDATPVQRRDSGCTRSGDTGTRRRDDSSETDPSAFRGRNHRRPGFTCDEGHYRNCEAHSLGAGPRTHRETDCGHSSGEGHEGNCGGDSVGVSTANL